MGSRIRDREDKGKERQLWDHSDRRKGGRGVYLLRAECKSSVSPHRIALPANDGKARDKYCGL